MDEHSGNNGETRGTPPAATRLVNMALAFWSSRLLLSADELGIFTALAGEPADAATLSRRLGLRYAALTDVLPGLVELGLLEIRDGLYRNTPDGSVFLDSHGQQYIGPWLALARASLAESLDLTASLRGTAIVPDRGTTSLSERMWADIADVLRTASL